MRTTAVYAGPRGTTTQTFDGVTPPATIEAHGETRTLVCTTRAADVTVRQMVSASVLRRDKTEAARRERGARLAS